ncbi:MAG TPA: hypothetical protein VMD28_01285, partial [Acidimicrobiales bacterium]|nr:hypothetical protein [Acidimicrobiales bacterium]
IPPSLVPATVRGIARVVTVAAGTTQSCAVTSAGTVECWGANFGGTLGDGSTAQSVVPVAVKGLVIR